MVGWISLVLKVQTWVLQAIPLEWTQFEKRKEFGSVKRNDGPGCYESVELGRGGAVRGFSGRFPVAEISMPTDWDVLLLQECFRKLDGVNVGSHELYTPSELLGGLRCPAVIVNQKWSGQAKAVGGAGRCTAVELDGQMTFISAHLPHKRKNLGEFESTLSEIQNFANGRPGQHL